MSRSIGIISGKTRARTAASDESVLARLREILGAEHVVVDPEKVEPYAQDAVKEKFPPEAVLFPRTAEEIAEILKLANEARFPVTARGGGVGYTGGTVPIEAGVVSGTDSMQQSKELSPRGGNVGTGA